MARLGLSSRAETNLNQVLEVQRFCLLFLHSLGRQRPFSLRHVAAGDWLSFQATVQVRNKLVSAYHDIMYMQVCGRTAVL